MFIKYLSLNITYKLGFEMCSLEACLLHFIYTLLSIKLRILTDALR